VDPVNIDFYKAVPTAQTNYLRYAIAARANLREIYRTILKLAATVQTQFTVRQLLDGKSEAHTARGTMDPAQRSRLIALVRTDATSMFTAHQLPGSHHTFILEAVKMLYTP
jgi:hypothetical protein